jgi:hypothetical protein
MSLDSQEECLATILFHLQENKRKYLVRVESQLSPRSRLKTYKGLFHEYKSVAEGEVFHAEVGSATQTFLVGFAKLSELNTAECFRLAGDITTSFLVISEAAGPRELSGALLGAVREAVKMTARGDIHIDSRALIPASVRPAQIVIEKRPIVNEDNLNLALFTHDVDKADLLTDLTRVKSLDICRDRRKPEGR